jgi:hypothetical protein
MGNASAVELVLAQARDELPEAPEASAPAPTPTAIVLPPLEVEPPRKPSWPTLAALAVATGAAAVGLGVWAVVSEMRSEPEAAPAALPDVERALAVLADASAERYPLRGSVGRIVLVVDGQDRAVLTLDGLGRSPSGSRYHAWLVAPRSAVPVAVAMFDASSRVVPLSQRVLPGARVAVTLEPATNATRPSRTLRLVALRPY